ncbi:DUF4097 family beta strand repeat-containing protein [Ruminococcus albus]|uniref:Putative adhesin n=1 Tax=Ruminococcus albus TaxID=1264 RepID=A0A1I1I2H9_RUMAL|nr:DUF4097 family beta strand repeat-containing protein [Ruminococcus albus]SFC30517.1 Putative adhesin [Ruminococcus albus]
MNNIDLEEKTYTTGRRPFPYFSVGMIVVGTVMLIGGAVFYKTSDNPNYKTILTSVSEDVELGKTESVKIDMGAGTLKVLPSSDDRVHIEGDVPKNYTLKESGGTLLVDLHSGWNLNFGFLDLDKTTVDATLYLPDKEYEMVELDVGAGEITVNDIKCKKASFETGAGELTAKGINCTGEVKVDIGAGDIKFTHSVTGGLDVDIGAGDFEYSGEVNGDIDVDCGVGDCDIELTNSKSEYDKKYSVTYDKGIGDVTVEFKND